MKRRTVRAQQRAIKKAAMARGRKRLVESEFKKISGIVRAEYREVLLHSWDNPHFISDEEINDAVLWITESSLGEERR